MKKAKLVTHTSVIALIMSICSCTTPGEKAGDNVDFVTGTDLNLSEKSAGVVSSLPGKLSSVAGVKRNAAPPLGPPTTREEMGNMIMAVKILNGKDNAGVSVPGFGSLQLSKEESSLSVYYIESKVYHDTVYGIGYSVHYLFKRVKKGLDITKLPYVAASVQLESNKTQVVYSIRTYGIVSRNMVKYFTPTVNKPFDVEGFGMIQTKIDGIQNVLADSVLSAQAKFTPEVLPTLTAADIK